MPYPADQRGKQDPPGEAAGDDSSDHSDRIYGRLHLDEARDAAENGKQAKDSSRIGDRQKEGFRRIPKELDDRCRLLRFTSSDNARQRHVELYSEPDERQPADELDRVAIVLDRSGNGPDTQGRAEGN